MLNKCYKDIVLTKLILLDVVGFLPEVGRADNILEI